MNAIPCDRLTPLTLIVVAFRRLKIGPRKPVSFLRKLLRMKDPVQNLFERLSLAKHLTVCGQPIGIRLS